MILKTPKLVEEESTKAESTDKIEGLSATKPPAMPRVDITESEDVNCKKDNPAKLESLETESESDNKIHAKIKSVKIIQKSNALTQDSSLAKI